VNAVEVLLCISMCLAKRDASLPERKSTGDHGEPLERLILRALTGLLND
jgi:hypothetical protein